MARSISPRVLLDLLQRRYGGVRPFVRLDLADDPDVHALRVLVAVESGLARKVPTVKPISFPRFELLG